MRSVEPSSSVTVPPPPQTPAMPANAPPDWAWLAPPAAETATTVAIAKIARRVKVVPRELSCFISLPPFGNVTNLAVRICTIERHQHKSRAADHACDVSAGAGALVAYCSSCGLAGSSPCFLA